MCEDKDNPTGNEPESERVSKLTLKQQRFIDEYLKDFNGTQAAIRAGFSERSARAIAYELLRKPEIKSEIESRCRILQLSSDEAKKLVSDIARGSLNDYFKITRKWVAPQIKVPIQDLIDQLEIKLHIESRVSLIAKLTGPEFLKQESAVTKIKVELARLKAEAEINPSATKITTGEPEEVEDVELDIAALVRDKERGRIKSFKINKFGMPEVELYAADNALRDILRIHGEFTDKVQLDGDMEIRWEETRTYEADGKTDESAG